MTPNDETEVDIDEISEDGCGHAECEDAGIAAAGIRS